MNCLIAKTTIRSRSIVKVLSDQEVFILPDNLDDAVYYAPETLNEDNQWYKLADFSSKEYCLDFLTEEFNSANYAEVINSDFLKVSYLCSYQESRFFYFQKLSSKGIVRKKWFKLSEPALISDEPILTINSIPDAVFDRETDVLYFRSLSSISSIFKGIDILYREATQEETETFLQSEMISLGNDFDATKVKTANRKRIAIAMDTFNGMTDENKRNIGRYIREYCVELTFDENNSTFSISNEEELKKLLYGIEQRYYTTPVTAEKRLANSVITL